MILKKREIWEESYIPSRILYRGDPLSKIDYFLKPVLSKGRAHNILCIGDYGTGKTVSVKFTTQAFNSKLKDNFKSYYINCAEYTREKKTVTLGRIITQCLREDNIKVYSTLPHEIKLSMFKTHIQNFDSTVFVLDEIDYYLVDKKNDFEAFAYLVSRSLPNTSLLLITNKFWVPDYLSEEIDTRVQDTFSKRLRIVSFSDYTEDELFGILLDRAKIGFEEGSYTEDVLDYIAHLSFLNGWRARGVINIARDAAELADEKGDKTIEFKHIDEIAEIVPQKELKEIIKKLDPPALNILLFLIKRKGQGIEKEALEWFKKQSNEEGIPSGRSRTTFYNALSRLKGMELVESEIKGRGRGMGRYAILYIQERHFQLVKEALLEFFDEQKSKDIVKML